MEERLVDCVCTKQAGIIARAEITMTCPDDTHRARIAAVCAAVEEWQWTDDDMTAQHVVMIDPNVRVAGNQTFSGFEDVLGDGLPDPGDRVIVREPESGVTGSAVVTRLDFDDRLIYLTVDWAGLKR